MAGRHRTTLGLLAACLSALLLVGSPAAGAAVAPVPTARAVSTTAAAADVLSAINASRRAKGLKPLRLATGLVRAAKSHANAMAAAGFFGHNSRDGTSPATRIRRFYEGKIVGETLLWRSPTVSADQALRMWLGSAPHRKILLSRSFREAGIGIVYAESAPGTYGGRPVTIVVADFGAR